MASPFISRRELARAFQIISVIGRYGLVPLVQASGIGKLFGVIFWHRTARRYGEIPPPVRVRLALIELGATFIKLGQVLSARSDLLPEEYLRELAKLQDNVPAVPFDQIEPVFRVDLGVLPFDAYKTFDTDPVAAASIGQVYHAQLHDGTDVVVKIQRPGVDEQINTDLSLLRRLADFANLNPRLRRYDFPALAREFSAILHDELLYTLEGHNAEALAAEMADRPQVTFPRVYWALTSRRVLTIQRIVGIKLTELHALDAAGINRHELAVVLANSLLEQILLYGMFHGDPHPGNLLATPDGKLAFLDTGMVGRLDRITRELLIELAVAIFDQDITAMLTHLQQLGIVQDVRELPGLRNDLSRLITKYYFLPRRELRLGELLQRVNSLLFEHRIRMAYEFGLMAKALFVAEGIAQKLDPDFDYNRAARPVIDEVRRRYYSLGTLFDDLQREWRGIRLQVVDLPRRLNNLLTQLEQGTIHFRTTDDLTEFRHGAISRMVNRSILAVITLGLLGAGVLLLIAFHHGWINSLAYGILIVAGLLVGFLIVQIIGSRQL